MKTVLKYLWYSITLNEVGVKEMRRKLFKPDFGKCLKNMLLTRNKSQCLFFRFFA